MMNKELSDLFTQMWNADEHYCEPGVEYELNLQGMARFHGEDRADEKLFTWLDEEKVFSRNTFACFRALLDNYEAELGKPEVVTAEERKENWDFLKACIATEPMRLAHDFLAKKNLVSPDKDDFRNKLYDLWFRLYRRKRGQTCQDSSGFEHVFVGELREGEVTGFHNWLQFYLLEKQGVVNYKGFFDRGTPDEKEVMPHIITLQFEWRGECKSKGSMFIGCSPEFELAMYTVAFLLDQGDITVRVADYDVMVVCHALGKYIGTCFPKCLEK